MASLEKLLRIFKTVHSNKVARVCRPLNTHFSLDAFCYSQINDAGGFFVLSNTPEDSIYYMENGLFKSNPFYFDPKSYIAGDYLLESVNNKEYQQSLQQCQMIAGKRFLLRMVYKENQCTHQFVFGTSNQTLSFDQIYIKHRSSLETFNHHFLSEMKPIIRESGNYEVLLPSLIGPKYFKKNPIENEIEKRTRFYKDLGISLHKLTNQEKSCSKQLLLGKTFQEIADELHLSRRTVESYVNNLKNKLGCNTRSELSTRLYEMNKMGIL